MHQPCVHANACVQGANAHAMSALTAAKASLSLNQRITDASGVTLSAPSPFHPPSLSLSSLQVVLGAELDYDMLHSIIFGSNKIVGKGAMSTAACGGQTGAGGTLLCFVVDPAASILFHPDKDVLAGGKPRFLGELEPALMESLLKHEVFAKVERASVEVSSKRDAEVLGYALDEGKLPLSLQLSGQLYGFVYMSNIKDTTSFLLAVEHYRTLHQAQGCGMLSSQCPNAHLPVIR